MDYLLLTAGLAILIGGGELLVKGATGIALRFNISTLVVGLTIVSFGTSVPELVACLHAALTGHPDITMGNVIGSNICNLALVLGFTAIIFPIAVNKDSIRIDCPVMIIASFLFYFLILDGLLNRWEGILFFLLNILFIIWIISRSRKQGLSVPNTRSGAVLKREVPSKLYRNISFVVIGCVGLALGAKWFIEGAVVIARMFEISERIIGLSLVAIATSLPELITSAIAAFRKQTDIAIGNLIGSNIFNILTILGVTSMVTSIQVDETIIGVDIYWMLGISVLILPLMLTRNKIGRIEGLLLLLVYAGYMYQLTIL